jgi:hypothetical protein
MGPAEERTVRLFIAGHFGQVGLAQDDRPRLAQPLHYHGVLLGDVVGERLETAGGAQASRLEDVFERHRHAVQGPPVLALRQRLVRLPGAQPRPLRVQGDHRVQSGVVRFDLAQVRLQHLSGGHLTLADAACQLARCAKNNIVHDGL